MPSIEITDFKHGIDRRRERVMGTPGTLWVAANCHVTRGGDIERCKKFVPVYELPANTFGMEQVNGQLFVFGSADLAASIPNGVQYQRLESPAAADMIRVLWSNTFDGKIYAIAEYEDGTIHHFYDGSRVTEWDNIVASAASYSTLAEYMARKIAASGVVDTVSFGDSILLTAREPGTAFTLAVNATDHGIASDETITPSTVQANVPEVPEVRPAGTVTITGGSSDPGVNQVTQITIDGQPLMAVPVNWIASNAATANAVAVEINNGTSTHTYSASATGAIITIQAAPGVGAAGNSLTVAATTSGDVTTTDVNTSGGVTYVAPVAQISKITFGGTFEAEDEFKVTLNGVDYVATGAASAHATSVFVYKGREYATAGSFYRFSQLNDPTDWTDNTQSVGAGAINVASDSEGNQRLVASAVYQQSVAVFARRSIRLYDLFADSEDNALKQVIENAGAVAPRSVQSYYNTDLLFLDAPGVRAVRVRDLNANAFVDDSGTQIDPLIQAWIDQQTEDVVERAVSVVEPLDGRYMLAIGPRIFVLSYFPRSKIDAWTYYEPGFTVTDFARVERRLYARDADTIYLYGGIDGHTYPGDNEQVVTAETPFVRPRSPAAFKEWTGFDAACSGVWRFQLLVDPTDESKIVNIGRAVDTTYSTGAIAAIGESTMFAVRATCSVGGRATLSSLMAHYEDGDSET